MRLLPLLIPCVVAACVSAPVVPVAPTTATSSSVNASAPRAVLVIDEVAGLGLFHDEAYEADAMIAAWAKTRGWSVVDPAKARVVFDRARAGKHATTGESCGLPLSRWRAMQRWSSDLGAQGRLATYVSCDDKTKACTLSILASDAFDFDGNTLADLAAPFDARAPWRDALGRALAALAPAPDDDGKGGLGLVGGLAGDGVQARPERLTFSAWSSRVTDGGSDALHDALALADVAPLRACFDDAGSASVAIEISDAGAITRCEPSEADAVSTCACRAFSEHATVAAIARGKRLEVSAHFTPADVVTPWGGVVTASARTYVERYKGRKGDDLFRPDVSDRSITDWKPPTDDRIARCFADVTAPAQARFRARVKFDALGRATGADLYDPKGFALSDVERECLGRALLASRTPCPASPATSALVEIGFSARPTTK